MGKKKTASKKTASAAAAPEPSAAVTPEASQPASAAPDPAAASPDVKGQVTIKFRDHTGQVTSRVFSEEQHGKDFKSLADEFRKKHAARIVA